MVGGITSPAGGSQAPTMAMAFHKGSGGKPPHVVNPKGQQA